MHSHNLEIFTTLHMVIKQIEWFLLANHIHNLEILITPHMVIKLTEDMHLSAAQKVYSCQRACVGDTDNAKLRVLYFFFVLGGEAIEQLKER